MSDIITEFVEEARGVTIAVAASRLGLAFKERGDEHPQPCPQAGGVDRFSFNTKDNVWVCRGCGAGGHDAIGMVAHCEDLDLKRRDGFLEACSLALGKPIPAGGEEESEDDKVARRARIAARRRQAAVEAERRAAAQVDFRERERRKARGIYEAAHDLVTAASAMGRLYLRERGCGIPDDRWLRVSAEVTYWGGQDERGDPVSLYVGPAQIAPFIGPDLKLIGCHITWIDLDRPPKFRPMLFGLTKKGRQAGRLEWRYGDPAPSDREIADELYEILPTKKMRGSKKGGLIPLAGHPSARRWLGGEGIENGLAFGRWERFRADTFYFAAGDLGNLAGPADPASRFAHPTLTRPDKNGIERPVMVQGPVPKPGQAPDDSMWVADHVDELVLLADADSEPVMTAAAMVRARARHQRPHGRPQRLTPVVWPGRAGGGMDFAAMMADHDNAYA